MTHLLLLPSSISRLETPLKHLLKTSVTKVFIFRATSCSTQCLKPKKVSQTLEFHRE